MRNAAPERVIRMVMIAGAALMISSCGHGDDLNGSSSTNSGGGSAGAGSEGVDNGANNVDLGQNDMDSNVAQEDAANGVTVGGQQGGHATGNGPM